MEPVPETYRGIPLLSCDVPEPSRRPNIGTCIYENDFAKAVVRHSDENGWGIVSFERKKLSQKQKEQYDNPPNILAPVVVTQEISPDDIKASVNDLVELIKPEESIKHDKKTEKFGEESPY